MWLWLRRVYQQRSHLHATVVKRTVVSLLAAQNVHDCVFAGTLETAVPRQAALCTQHQLLWVLQTARLARRVGVDTGTQKRAYFAQLAQLSNRLGIQNVGLRHPRVGNDSCLVAGELCQRRLAPRNQFVVEHGHQLSANARPTKNQHGPYCCDILRVLAVSSLQGCQNPPVKVETQLQNVDLGRSCKPLHAFSVDLIPHLQQTNKSSSVNTSLHITKSPHTTSHNCTPKLHIIITSTHPNYTIASTSTHTTTTQTTHHNLLVFTQISSPRS